MTRKIKIANSSDRANSSNTAHTSQCLIEKSLEAHGTLMIGDYEFFGPYTDLWSVKSAPGLMALLMKDEGDFNLIEMNETSDLRRSARFASYTHVHKPAMLAVAVYYTNGLTHCDRQALRDEIMAEFEH